MASTKRRRRPLDGGSSPRVVAGLDGGDIKGSLSLRWHTPGEGNVEPGGDVGLGMRVLRRAPRVGWWVWGILAVLLVSAPASAQSTGSSSFTEVRAPELRFEAPAPMARTVERLQSVDSEPLERIARLVGLDDPGPPIRVVLAGEGTSAARRAPSWVVGYAVGAAGLVVLLPQRVPSYPDRSLESVLLHEVAHVLIARAAGRRPVPRWLNEGIAMAVSRVTLTDRTALVFATFRRGDVSLADLDRAFPAGPTAARQAYALSGAVVRWLLDTYGEGVVAEILGALARGKPFAAAFEGATGTPVTTAEATFWRQLDIWQKWVPFLTSSTFLWLLISMLAVVAFLRRRRLDEEQRARWEAEEAFDRQTTLQLAGPPVERGEAPPGGWVH